MKLLVCYDTFLRIFIICNFEKNFSVRLVNIIILLLLLISSSEQDHYLVSATII